MLRSSIIVAIFLLIAHRIEGRHHPLSDEYINEINQKQSSWIAGRNFDIDTPWSAIQRIANTVLPENKHIDIREVFYDINGTNTSIPESFDAREAWPDCPSIGEIADQGACASGWAIAAVTTMTDRICINSNGTKQTTISAEDLLACCKKCRFDCDAGYPSFAWEYYIKTGIVSGGYYNSTDGCKAYSFEPCGHFNESSRPLCNTSTIEFPECKKECDADSSVSYEADLNLARNYYSLRPDVDQLKLEIMANGPVQATFDVYEDFLNYKSGVYITSDTDNEFVGYHSAKIIGWGVENNQSYWLVANSWNTDWGDEGLFKYLEGQNQLDMEVQTIAGLPNLD